MGRALIINILLFLLPSTSIAGNLILAQARFATECRTTEFVGFNKVHTEEDDRAYNRAKFVCSFHYPRSPCLVKLEKQKEHAYHATCGAGKSQ